MAFMAGKFARFRLSSTAVTGPFRWSVGFRRERLDTTNFESVAGLTGVNVHSEGLTGVLDSTFTVEGVVNDTTVNIFFPDAALTVDLLYRKSIQLGYTGIYADVLSFQPSTSVRDKAAFTCEMQASGLVSPAA